jgi:hypothetical protein
MNERGLSWYVVFLPLGFPTIASVETNRTCGALARSCESFRRDRANLRRPLGLGTDANLTGAQDRAR